MKLNRAKPGASSSRRSVLTAGLGALTASPALLAAGRPAAPQISPPNERVVLNIVTAWSVKNVRMVALLDRFSQRVFSLSGGLLIIKGQHQEQGGIAAPDLLGAVASGRIDMAHSSPQHWAKLSGAFNFFAAVPFGMTAQEHFTWLRVGGGLDLWRKLAAKSGVDVLPCGNTGPQMGGWFHGRLSTPRDLRGLKIFYSGLGAEVFRRLGALPVMSPAAGVKAALASGELDGAEGASLAEDLALGFQEVCNNYYYPGVLQPGSTSELLINPQVWSALSSTQQEVVRTACWLECNDSLAVANHENARALPRISQSAKLQLLRFPGEVVRALRTASTEVIRDAVGGDSLSGEVLRSYTNYQRQQLRWAELADRAYWQARYT